VNIFCGKEGGAIVNFLNWLFIEPFWDVVDVIRALFAALLRLFS